MEIEFITLILKRSTAARIFNDEKVASSDKDEIIEAFDDKTQLSEGEKSVTIQLKEEVAKDWLEQLQSDQKIDQVLAATLRAAFAKELGAFIDPSSSWTVQD